MGGICDCDFAFIRNSDVKIVHETLCLRGNDVALAGSEENSEVFGGVLRGSRGRKAANRELTACIEWL